MATKQNDFLESGLTKVDATNLVVQQPAPQQLSPLTVIQTAVERGTDVDSMERLLAMYERSEAARRRDAYNNAMAACQKAMPAIKRDAFNQQTNSHYTRLETLASAIRPVYTEFGFSLSFGSLPDAPAGHCRISCEVRHTEGHVERYQGDFPIDDKGIKGSTNKTGIQGMGSTISYARRYLTLMIFNIALGGEDDDGNGPQDETLISEQQLAALDDELRRMPPPERQPAVDDCLKWAMVEKLADLPASKYGGAMAGFMRRSTKYNS